MTAGVAVEPAPAVPSIYAPAACPDGCCVVVVDRVVTPTDWVASVNTIRPMFQVLYDDANWPGEQDMPFTEDDPNGMRIPHADYLRPDRIFL